MKVVSETQHLNVVLICLEVGAFSKAPSSNLMSWINFCVILGKLLFSLIVTIISMVVPFIERAILSFEIEYFVSVDGVQLHLIFEIK